MTIIRMINTTKRKSDIDCLFFSVSLLSNLMQARRNLDQQTRKILELNKEDCPSYCRVFNEIQQKLKSIAGYDDMITGIKWTHQLVVFKSVQSLLICDSVFEHKHFVVIF